MPIQGTHAQKVEQLLSEYKKSGKIGNTTPRDMNHAKEIANAIAFRKERGKK